MPRFLSTACLLCLLAAPASAAQPAPAAPAARQKIAVLELAARGVAGDTARSLTDVVAREVDRSGLFTTLSADDIRAMLQHLEHRQSLGCTDEACLAELGGALGVELVLSGAVGKVGETWVVSLTLLDVRRAVVIAREERTAHGAADALLVEARSAARALLRPLLAQAEGALRLECEEEGAEVYVDELMIGTTPLELRKLPGGHHALRVKKESFVVFARDVLVEPGRTVTVQARLLPSADFVERYEASARTYRALAWTFTALGAAAAGASAGLGIWNQGRLEDYRVDRRRFLEEGSGDPAELNAQADSINLVDSLTWAVGGVGLAALAGALVFWLTGDPPGRYDGIVPAGGEQTGLRLLPLAGPDGLGASLELSF
ncbi:MAG TPA: PEGA domain-containing protein [Myxococcota bacterium]|nr:PEGA domain-containing protein [Myxococcota bacterium]HRY94944.1 PEGA domain-containing protein [Myxococcota bacterium]HSA22608.1 PEGA domain-containing protein [Myxococcota bacterium]